MNLILNRKLSSSTFYIFLFVLQIHTLRKHANMYFFTVFQAYGGLPETRQYFPMKGAGASQFFKVSFEYRV